MRKAFSGGLVLSALALAACTTAGPYVTNISSDGNYGLTVEKCSVHMNAFMGTVSTGECTSQNIKLQRPN
jgi:type IV secretion system protein VirB7